jgi:hypothetical protein
MEEGLVITALAGHEFRPAFLDWFAENPGSGATAPLILLDRVAKVREELLKELLALPADQGNGAKALTLIRARLGSANEAGSSSSLTKRSCCGG